MSEHRTGGVERCVRDDDLDRAEGLDRLLGETGRGLRVGEVEVERVRLATSGTDRLGGLLAPVDTTRAEHDRVPGGGQRLGGGLADPRGCAGHHRRSPLGMWSETRHQRRSTAIGSVAKPRTLIECTRSAPDSSIS